MTRPDGQHDEVPFEERDRQRGEPRRPAHRHDPGARTLLLEMTTRALFPTVLVFSVYLLLVGHYGPGGGFAAGLVAGLAFVLRHISGGGAEIGDVLQIRPPAILGTGLAIALLTGLTPAVFGAPLLSSTKVEGYLPLLGHLEFQTSVVFDVGVYLLIVGAVTDLLRSLGAGIERDMQDAGEER